MTSKSSQSKTTTSAAESRIDSLLKSIDALKAKVEKQATAIDTLREARQREREAITTLSDRLNVLKDRLSVSKDRLKEKSDLAAERHAELKVSKGQLQDALNALEMSEQDKLVMSTEMNELKDVSQDLVKTRGLLSKLKDSRASTPTVVSRLKTAVTPSPKPVRVPATVRHLASLIRDCPADENVAAHIFHYAQTGGLDLFDLLLWIDKLIAERRIETVQDVAKNLEGLTHSEALKCALYSRARVAIYLGHNHPQFSDLFEHVKKGHTLRPVERRFINVAALVALAESNDAVLQISEHLIKAEKLWDLPRGTRVGLLRALGEASRFDLLRDAFTSLDALSNEERLYMLGLFLENQTAYAPLFPNLDTRDTDQISQLLINAVHEHPDSVKGLIEDRLVPALTSIPPDSDFMNARGDDEALTALEEFISAALDDKQGLSLIRLGDGECYIYPPESLGETFEKQMQDDFVLRELSWWGEAPTAAQSRKARNRILKAVNSASILGVPSLYRLIRDIPTNRRGLDIHRSLRGGASVLLNLEDDLASGRTLYTEERIHYLLYKSGFLETIVKKADHLVVLGSWSKDAFEGTFLERADIIQVSPHQKVKDVNSDVRPLFETWPQFDKELSKLCREGSLVLVGAGVVGKIFLETARKNGAVALDVGAVLDYMVGRRTRSSADV